MTKALDITGKRYGNLVAIKANSYGSQGARWNFLCDCGNTKEIRLKDVTYGNTASCGCLQARSNANTKTRINVARPWASTPTPSDA